MRTPASVVGTDWHQKHILLRTTFQLDRIPAALRLSLHHDALSAETRQKALNIGFVDSIADSLKGAVADADIVFLNVQSKFLWVLP